MKDYLRNNSKWILTILSVFLMLAWLVNPSGKTADEAKAGRKIGTLDGRKITNADLGEADFTMNVLGAIPVRISADQQVTMAAVAAVEMQLDRRHQSLQLYLMMKEAKRYHMGVSQQEIANQLAEWGVADESKEPRAITLLTLSKAFSTDSDAIRQAVGNYLLAKKVYALTVAAAQPSLPELRELAATTNTTMDARYLMFDARFPSSLIPEPTAAQMAAQFADYKSVFPVGLGERSSVKGHDFPFGYKYPDRVKVEYLLFNREMMRKLPSVQATPADYLEIRREYDKNPRQYKRNEDASTTQPATQPDYLSFDEVKGRLIEARIESKIDLAIRDAVALVTQKMTVTAFEPALDNDGFRIRLKDASGSVRPLVSYDVVADEIQKQFGFRPDVVVGTLAAPANVAGPMAGHAPADWLNALQLRNLAGIGASAYVRDGKLVARFEDMALNVRALHATVEARKLNPTYRYLQVGVEGPPLIDVRGNTYLYRVDDASTTHEPASLDEVRSQVSADLRQRAAFEQFTAAAPEEVALARSVGIDGLAQKLSMTLHQTEPFPAAKIDSESNPYMQRLIQPVITDIGQSESNATLGQFPEFARAVYRAGTVNALAATTRPAASAPATMSATKGASTQAAPANLFMGDGHPVGFVASEARLQVVVFEVTHFAPPPADSFEQFRKFLAEMPIDTSHTAPVATELQMLANRMKFTPSTSFDEDTGD